MMRRQQSSSNNALPPLFRMAAITGVKAAVMLHLRGGANVNATDDKGRSPLVLAAERGHAEICQILLEAGADPTLQDSEGNDALSVAINNGQKEVEAVLTLHLLPPQVEATPLETVSSGFSVPSHSPTEDDATFSGDQARNIVLDDDAFDLSMWEVETESPPPPNDLNCLASAEEIQKRISDHVPIDVDEDWLDVDIDLPEIFASRRRTTTDDDARWQIDARRTILDGLHDGWVTEEQLTRSVPCDEEDDTLPDVEYATALQVVLGEIGILVDDVPESVIPHPPRQDDEDDFFEGREDLIANEAISFLVDLQSYVNDPLTQYIRDVGPRKKLSRDEEIALAHEIAEGTRGAFGAISRSPPAVAEILDWAGRIERGDVPFRSVISDGMDTEHEEGPGQAKSGDVVDEGDEEIDADDGESGDVETALNMPLQVAVPPEFLDRIKSIRNLHTRMVVSKSRFERSDVAGRLRDEIVGLDLSNEFVGRLCKIVDGDNLDSEVRHILASGLKRAREAKQKFAEYNLRLVLWVARKHRGLPLMDLVQEGNIGLLKAIDRFDPLHGVKFSTYATWWIRQSITRAVADKRRLIRLPVHMVESVRKIENASNALTARTGRVPIAEELAITLDLPIRKVRRILRVPDEPLPMDAIPDLGRPLQEIIADPIAPTPEDIMVRTEMKAALREAIGHLTEKDAQVIGLRFGLEDDNDHTLEEIGQMYGVTRERIRQIEAKALCMLAHPGRCRKLRSFLHPAGRTGGSD